MKKYFISHRGNLVGKNPNRENSIDYIVEAIDQGFDVEIDVWHRSGSFYLGHDNPEYLIEEHFLMQPQLWCHAKNYTALYEMIKLGVHCFWHESDKVTITSNGFIWAYPGQQPLSGSIAVMPEINGDDVSKCIGVCSDYISNYKEK